MTASAEASAAGGTPETIFRDARAYTVRIRTTIETPFLEDQAGSFSGAGFLVDAGRGWIVTNAHVVGQSPSTVEVAFADGVYKPARKIYVDSFTDMAVVEVELAGATHPAAPLDCAHVPQVGEAVGVFGHPLGIPFTGTRGIVSGATDQATADLVQIDATVDHGNSGGPVIALGSGRIIGIATAGAGGDKSDRVNFATPMKDVCRILELLRQGVHPDPAVMSFSLLKNEDDRHTLEVGRTFDDRRWPFAVGDRIVAVGEEGVRVSTLTDLVRSLRGREGEVPIRIQRGGKDVTIQVRPERRPSVIERRGVRVDGALFAPNAFEDGTTLSEPARILVHSLEPASQAELLGVQRLDVVESIDGRRFEEFDALAAYLRQRPAGAPIRIVLRRMSDRLNRWFDYHSRVLPGAELKFIGPEGDLLSSAP